VTHFSPSRHWCLTVGEHTEEQERALHIGVAIKAFRRLPAKKRWQPQIRAKVREKAATTDGIVIDTRARIGYTAPIGSTDDARLRHLTVALPPQYAARLFEAQEQGATDQRLQEIAAEALKEVYFQDGGRRAGSLEEVRFTDIEYLEFDL
jgi:hypothetical protein